MWRVFAQQFVDDRDAVRVEDFVSVFGAPSSSAVPAHHTHAEVASRLKTGSMAQTRTAAAKIAGGATKSSGTPSEAEAKKATTLLEDTEDAPDPEFARKLELAQEWERIQMEKRQKQAKQAREGRTNKKSTGVRPEKKQGAINPSSGESKVAQEHLLALPPAGSPDGSNASQQLVCRSSSSMLVKRKKMATAEVVSEMSNCRGDGGPWETRDAEGERPDSQTKAGANIMVGEPEHRLSTIAATEEPASTDAIIEPTQEHDVASGSTFLLTAVPLDNGGAPTALRAGGKGPEQNPDKSVAGIARAAQSASSSAAGREKQCRAPLPPAEVAPEKRNFRGRRTFATRNKAAPGGTTRRGDRSQGAASAPSVSRLARTPAVGSPRSQHPKEPTEDYDAVQEDQITSGEDFYAYLKARSAAAGLRNAIDPANGGTSKGTEIVPAAPQERHKMNMYSNQVVAHGYFPQAPSSTKHKLRMVQKRILNQAAGAVRAYRHEVREQLQKVLRVSELSYDDDRSKEILKTTTFTRQIQEWNRIRAIGMKTEKRFLVPLVR
ncbi:unnamed protein product [Amoebophrya sp. A120]|nr:unnamed protein product [Amoebophrya sp. A120]|eukprot:GSA120T00011810001.1